MECSISDIGPPRPKQFRFLAAAKRESTRRTQQNISFNSTPNGIAFKLNGKRGFAIRSALSKRGRIEKRRGAFRFVTTRKCFRGRAARHFWVT